MNVFYELLHGKRIAAVGPSPHLKGSGLGPRIDSYDVVCRFNEVRPKGLETGYGSRVDVMFWHLNNCDMNDFKLHADLDPDGFNSAKLLVYPRQHGDVNRRGCGSSTPEKNAKQLPDIPFYQVDTNTVSKWETDYSAHLNVGVLGLLMMLEVPFKELFVCGFSFYKTDTCHHDNHPLHANKHTTSHGVGAGILALKDHVVGKNVTGDDMFNDIILKNS